jgi:hypothetical protein
VEIAMLEQLLGGNQANLISTLSKTMGVSGNQAGGFLNQAIKMLEGLLGSGKIDPSALLKGDLAALTSKLDMKSLASLIGGDTAKAQQGLGAILGSLTQNKSGLESMLGQLAGSSSSGGLMGAAKGIAGKLFRT